ncbi:MAG: flavodoxin family protein [Promethearchaeota archaeon]
MAKLILLINGSPRKKGLTNSMCQIFAEKIGNLNLQESEAKKTDIVIEQIALGDFQIVHCNACDVCLRKPHVCPLNSNDDMDAVAKKMRDADAIIIASPSYFSNVTGLVKDLIDRSRPLKMAKYELKNKYFAPIVTAGLRAGGLNAVQNSLIQYALIQGMIVIGALGHPVLMSNFPTETGQKLDLKDFRKVEDISSLAQANCEALAERFWNILQ